MIRHLLLTDVGPVRSAEFAFGSRLNLLTGDNGLGKTFVLDAVWAVLTGTWAGRQALPYRGAQQEREQRRRSLSPNGLAARDGAAANGPEFGHGTMGTGRDDLDPRVVADLSTDVGDGTLELRLGGAWQWSDQRWTWTAESPGTAGPSEQVPEAGRPLVIYARTDGSFALFDGAFNSSGHQREVVQAEFKEGSFSFSPQDIWDGKSVADALRPGERLTSIPGLISDWVRWQRTADSQEFAALTGVLSRLSAPGESLVPGDPVRVDLRDRRDIPTLTTTYGTVPVTLASSAIQRVLSLAYLLVWAWNEHCGASAVTRRRPTRDIVVLVDEPELHQHPAWQRTFLPALLDAVRHVASGAAVQIIAATHSPLVLASMEPLFDRESDKLFTFDLDAATRRVVATELPWRRRGDVSSWLCSEVFDLESSRSLDAERALKRALAALGSPGTSDAEAAEIHAALHAALGETDPFWARWLDYAESKGIGL